MTLILLDYVFFFYLVKRLIWTCLGSACYTTIAMQERAFPTITKKELAMTINELFEAMPSHFNAAAAAGMTKTFQWSITGDGASVWAFKIVNGEGELVPGGVEKPDITITVSDQDWISIVEGKLDPTSAFMSGRLKVSGDMMLAMRLQNLFPNR